VSDIWWGFHAVPRFWATTTLLQGAFGGTANREKIIHTEESVRKRRGTRLSKKFCLLEERWWSSKQNLWASIGVVWLARQLGSSRSTG